MGYIILSKHNSASRILKILREAVSCERRNKTYEVWSSVFDISEDDVSKNLLEVARYLGLVRKEIDYLYTQAQSTNDEFDSVPVLDAISFIFSAENIQAPWESKQNKCTREVYLCLGYFRESMEDEHKLIDDNDTVEITESLDTLRSILQKSTLPENIRNVISDILNHIYESLRHYDVIGAQTLEDALKSVAGDVVMNSDILSENKDTEEVRGLKGCNLN